MDAEKGERELLPAPADLRLGDPAVRPRRRLSHSDLFSSVCLVRAADTAPAFKLCLLRTFLFAPLRPPKKVALSPRLRSPPGISLTLSNFSSMRIRPYA